MRTVAFILIALVLQMSPAPAEPVETPTPQAVSDWLPDLWNGLFEIDGQKYPVAVTFMVHENRMLASVFVFGHEHLSANADPVDATESTVSFSFTNAVGDWRFAGTYVDGRIEGAFERDGKSVATTLLRHPMPKIRRPQEPKPPFPYQIEEVAIGVEAGATVVGTLTRPEGEGPFPAVLLISNVGGDSDNAFFIDHRPYAVIADHLSRHGFIVLRYQGRGGFDDQAWWDGPDPAALAADAGSLVRYLAARQDVASVGVIGTAEGGVLAGMCAADTPEVSCLGLLSTRAMPAREMYVSGDRVGALARGMTPAQADRCAESTRRLMTAVLEGADEVELRALILEGLILNRVGPPEMLDQRVDGKLVRLRDPRLPSYLAHDPAHEFERVKVPILAIYGANDMLMDVKANAAALKQALGQGAEERLTAIVLPSLNRFLQPEVPGSSSDPNYIDTTIDVRVLDAIESWLTTHLVNAAE